jgi:hypothetical protein
LEVYRRTAELAKPVAQAQRLPTTDIEEIRIEIGALEPAAQTAFWGNSPK